MLDASHSSLGSATRAWLNAHLSSQRTPSSHFIWRVAGDRVDKHEMHERARNALEYSLIIESEPFLLAQLATRLTAAGVSHEVCYFQSDFISRLRHDALLHWKWLSIQFQVQRSELLI